MKNDAKKNVRGLPLTVSAITGYVSGALFYAFMSRRLAGTALPSLKSVFAHGGNPADIVGIYVPEALFMTAVFICGFFPGCKVSAVMLLLTRGATAGFSSAFLCHRSNSVSLFFAHTLTVSLIVILTAFMCYRATVYSSSGRNAKNIGSYFSEFLFFEGALFTVIAARQLLLLLV